MPLIAILIDLFCVGLYFFQYNYGNSFVYILGLIIQGILSLFLIIVSLTYKGKKYNTHWTFGIYNTTARYDLIVISAIVNTLMLILYGMNAFGINNVIFSR
ncbi:hypothetical protein K9P40_05890 [Lentilactobacillus otakiensis]|nr:hypothetical protein [Lentilactobacillus otakiensis]